MDTPLCLPHKASLIFKNSLSYRKRIKQSDHDWKRKKIGQFLNQIFFCERIMIIIRRMSARARLIFLMRIFPSQERQFLDPSSPSVNYGNRKPFHVGTLKLLCLSKWFDLINNCEFIKKVAVIPKCKPILLQSTTGIPVWDDSDKWCKQRAHHSTATMSLFTLSGRLKKMYNENVHSISRTVRIQETSKTS